MIRLTKRQIKGQKNGKANFIPFGKGCRIIRRSVVPQKNASQMREKSELRSLPERTLTEGTNPIQIRNPSDLGN